MLGRVFIFHHTRFHLILTTVKTKTYLVPIQRQKLDLVVSTQKQNLLLGVLSKKCKQLFSRTFNKSTDTYIILKDTDVLCG